MQAEDNADATMLVWADWLLDQDRYAASDEVREEVEKSSVNDWYYEYSGGAVVGGGVVGVVGDGGIGIGIGIAGVGVGVAGDGGIGIGIAGGGFGGVGG